LIAHDDAEPQVLAKLEAGVRELLGPDAADIFPFVATLMGLHPSGVSSDRVRGIEGEALEKLIQKSIRDLFQALARRRPLVLFFDDVHWADVSSINLLRAVLPLVETSAVLFLIALRPAQAVQAQTIVEEIRHRFPDRHLGLHLSPLDEKQCAHLLRNLLKLDERPHTTRAVILSKTEGNPFFIEEVIRSLIEQEAILETDAGLRVTEKIESIEVPATVQEVVMARVDRLPDDVRRVLQLASVIGRSVPVRVLATVADDHQQVSSALEYLEHAQLLEARQTGDDPEYVFKHALAREAVYESLLLRTRRELHRAIAQSIESLYAERLPEYFGMLAYHFNRAEVPEKAEDYLFRAGEQAVLAAGSSEALHYFQEASRLYLQVHGGAGDPHKKALLEKNIGLALLNRGDLLGSVDHFNRALQLFGERVPVTPLRTRCQLLLDAAVLASRVSLRRLAGPARSTDRETFEIRYHRARAQTTSDPKRFFPDSIGTARRLTETDPKSIDQASSMYTGVAAMFCWSGLSFTISKRFLEIARTLVREGNLRDDFACRSFAFVMHYLEGDWSDQHVVPEELVEQALWYGQFWDVNTYRGLNCERLIQQGDFAGARREIERIRQLADDYGYEFARSNEYAMPALLLLQQRQLPGALAVVERYYAERHEELLNLVALGTKAKIQLYAGDPDASTTLAQAEELYRRLPLVPYYHMSTLAQSRLIFDVGAVEQSVIAGSRSRWSRLVRRAHLSARQALRMSRSVARDRVEVYRLVGRLCWLIGDHERAIQRWQRGILEGERMRARPELARTYLELGQRLVAAGQGDRIVGDHRAAGYVERAERWLADLGLEPDTVAARALVS
jgi:tetratricopeptide (TPR) repeat protein